MYRKYEQKGGLGKRTDKDTRVLAKTQETKNIIKYIL